MATDCRARALSALLREIELASYAFVPPTPETHRRVNARPGNELARDLRGIFGWSRPFSKDAVDPRILALMAEADALGAVGENWKSRLRVATLQGRPYFHSAFPTIQADAVFFGPDTYRFVRAALAALPDRRFRRAIDLGCGAGAGGLAIAAARQIDDLFLTDINPAALTLARINAAHQGRAAAFIEGDLFAGLTGGFDLIVANPPYLADPARRVYRDGGGELGLSLGLRIVEEGVSRLKPGGVLFLYTGTPIIGGVDQFRDAMEQTLPKDGFQFEYGEIDPDVFGEELEAEPYGNADRIAVIGLRVTRTRK